MRYYLARWELDTDAAGGYWRAPASGCVGLVDLRPLPAQGTLLTVDGYGFFAYPNTVDPALMPGQIDLGNNLDKAIENKDKVENAFGVTLTGKTITDVLWEVLTTKSDPKGLTGPKPIIPGVRRNLELHLGGHSIIRAEDFDLATAPHRLQVIEVMQDAYREAKQEASKYTDTRKDTHLRMLSVFADKYREDYKTFIPNDLPDEGTKEPRTSFGDSFNRADNTDLNAVNTGKTKDGGAGTWQWNEVQGDVEVQSNAFFNVATAVAYARADDDLAGADHFCEGDTSIVSIQDNQWGPCARFASAANTSYMFMRNTANPLSTSIIILRKTITGSRTSIGTSKTQTAAAGEKITTRIDGSTLSGEHDDVELDSITDTAIAGGTRGGIYITVQNVDNIAVDDWFCEDISAGQTIAIGLVTETDLAQGLTVLKQRALAQAVEADLAQAVSSAKARAINRVTETDLSQGLSVAKARGVGQVTETDLAQAMAWAPRHRLVGQVTETNLAQTIGRLKSRAVGQITETDLAQALAVVKALAVAQISETDLAQPLSVAGEFFIGVGQVTEADLAQAVSWAPKIRLLGRVMETDLAQALSVLKLLGVGQVMETDLARVLSVLKTLGVGQVTETDLAQAIGRLKTRVLGQVTETDLAQVLGRLKVRLLGQITETDLAQAIAWLPTRLVEQVVETDLAQLIGALKVRGVGQVLESDSVFAVGVERKYTLGLVVEADAAQALLRLKTTGIGQVFEVDVAFALLTVPPIGEPTRLVSIVMTQAVLVSIVMTQAVLADIVMTQAVLEDIEGGNL